MPSDSNTAAMQSAIYHARVWKEIAERNAAEIERLRALLFHYGDMCGCDADEMREKCGL